MKFEGKADMAPDSQDVCRDSTGRYSSQNSSPKTLKGESTITSARSLFSSTRDIEVKQNVRQMGIRHASFSVLACVISIASISLLGLQFAKVGVVTQILIIAFTFSFNFFSFWIIMRLEEILDIHCFSDMVAKTLGSKVKIFLTFLNILCSLSTSVASIVFLKNVVPQIISTSFQNVHPLLLSQKFWAIVLTEGLLIPITFMKRIKGMSYISAVTSMGHIVYLMFVVTYLVRMDPQPQISKIPKYNTNFNDIVEVYMLCQFNYLVQPNIQEIFAELKQPTLRRKMTSMLIAYLIIAVPYFIIGFLTALIFVDDRDTLLQKGNVFKIDSYISWLPMRILATVFAVTPFVAAIIMNLTVKNQLSRLFCNSIRDKLIVHIFNAILVGNVILLFALAIPTLSLSMRISSAILYPFVMNVQFQMSYIVPGIIYLKAEKETTLRYKVAKVMTALWLIFISLFIIYGSYQIFNEL